MDSNVFRESPLCHGSPSVGLWEALRPTQTCQAGVSGTQAANLGVRELSLRANLNCPQPQSCPLFLLVFVNLPFQLNDNNNKSISESHAHIFH